MARFESRWTRSVSHIPRSLLLSFRDLDSTRYVWKNGDRYDGEWRENKVGHRFQPPGGYIRFFFFFFCLIRLQKCGRGRKTFVNGDEYNGEWKNDRPHGFGTFIWAKAGERYEVGSSLPVSASVHVLALVLVFEDVFMHVLVLVFEYTFVQMPMDELSPIPRLIGLLRASGLTGRSRATAASTLRTATSTTASGATTRSTARG